MAWSGNKLLLGTENGEVLLWEATTFTELARTKGHTGDRSAMKPLIFTNSLYPSLFMLCDIMCKYTGSITSVDVSKDGKTVVSGSRDKCISVWSLQ